MIFLFLFFWRWVGDLEARTLHCKAILGHGQSHEPHPRCRIDRSGCWSAALRYVMIYFVMIYAMHYPFLLNKICLNQYYFALIISVVWVCRQLSLLGTKTKSLNITSKQRRHKLVKSATLTCHISEASLSMLKTFRKQRNSGPRYTLTGTMQHQIINIQVYAAVFMLPFKVYMYLQSRYPCKLSGCYQLPPLVLLHIVESQTHISSSCSTRYPLLLDSQRWCGFKA